MRSCTRSAGPARGDAPTDRFSSIKQAHSVKSRTSNHIASQLPPSSHSKHATILARICFVPLRYRYLAPIIEPRKRTRSLCYYRWRHYFVSGCVRGTCRLAFCFLWRRMRRAGEVVDREEEESGIHMGLPRIEGLDETEPKGDNRESRD